MICISIAHSCSTPGAVGRFGLTEYEVSIRASLECFKKLQEAEVACALYDCGSLPPTRYDDAKVKACDGITINDNFPLLLELHCNSSINRLACYSETIYSPNSPKGKSAASAIAASLNDLTMENIAWRSNGAREDDRKLFFLEHTTRPAVIVEGMFISNQEQEVYLKQDGAEKYGQLVAEGVLAWVKQ